ncbi:DUF4124 domain-containing protein [Zooshikella harenae]|uniref:DUF4124 domain-containing protein n=1 Tax=Zooshikella harenae TaxID=2827238 RepID=A0ABS5Z5X0_9GAMM|nr:DUF4124 domain-containing protein [Zooshikella harenae]MBU2709460.1 DUF4124 domain-containing protein [Zooshikella harenae]
MVNKMPKSCQQVVVSVLLLVASCLVQAEMYQWRDEQGRVHYSDKPPASAEQQVDKVDIRVKNNDFDYMDESRMEALRRQEQNKSVRDELVGEEKGKQEKQEKQKLNLCQKLRSRLKTLEGPVQLLDKEGNPVNISEKEREAKAKQLREQVQQYCAQ